MSTCQGRNEARLRLPGAGAAAARAQLRLVGSPGHGPPPTPFKLRRRLRGATGRFLRILSLSVWASFIPGALALRGLKSSAGICFVNATVGFCLTLSVCCLVSGCCESFGGQDQPEPVSASDSDGTAEAESPGVVTGSRCAAGLCRAVASLFSGPA